MNHDDMPGMGEMSGTGGVGMVDILPSWAGWGWAAVFVVVMLLHVQHAIRMHGAHRLWHSGHILMALGMAYMFLPQELLTVPNRPWQLGFAGATVLAMIYAGYHLRHGIRVDTPWLTLTFGLALMVYMWAMMDGLVWPPFTYLAAAWFGAEAAGWFTGHLCGDYHHRSFVPPAFGPRRKSGRRISDVGPYLAGCRPIAYGTSWGGRMTLGVMAIGMGYMLLAMQLMV
jgi:Domain of unknown function (DUF5134)